MGFRLTPRSMILDDLELLQGQILLEFRDNSRVSKAITAKRMKIDLYCQQRNCSLLNVLFSDCTDCIDIARRSSARGASNNVEVAKQVFIHTRLSRAYLALARLLVACAIYSNRFSDCTIPCSSRLNDNHSKKQPITYYGTMGLISGVHLDSNTASQSTCICNLHTSTSHVINAVPQQETENSTKNKSIIV